MQENRSSPAASPHRLEKAGQLKLGLKLWSTNAQYIDDAVRLYREKLYDYIELFVEPGTYRTNKTIWAGINIPFIIHAPHYDRGLNLAQRDQSEQNTVLAKEAIAYADLLHADTVIFHPGIEGDTAETARQLRLLRDPRMVVENKPHFGHHGVLCNGSTPEEISFIMERANVGFCLDVGHAICSANVKAVAPLDYLRKFLTLGPKMFHLTDGHYSGAEDRHDHFGRGDYPLKDILLLLPNARCITVETIKDSPSDLKDFEEDIYFIRNLNRV